MQRLGWMVALVVIAVACGTAGDMVGEMLDSGVPDAGAETPGDGTSMQYVGNSTQTFSGNDSWDDSDTQTQVRERRFDWYRACQADFGPGHRMCTTDEIIFTTDIPPLDEGAIAWIDPLSETCSRFSDTSATTRRAAVDDRGSLFLAYCASNGGDTQNGELEQRSFRPIACCGPK